MEFRVSSTERCSDNPGCSSGERYRGPCHVRVEDFQIHKQIGLGGFGTVYLVQKRGGIDTGILYAMKVMDKTKIITSNFCDKIMTERRVLEDVAGIPFLMQLHYAFQTDRNVYLILDYCKGGDLSQLLKKSTLLPERDVRFYSAEIVLAVDNLHKMRILHRDIKPGNILLGNDGHIVLADYGLCKMFCSCKKVKRTFSVVGTSRYMAPEILTHTGYAFAADWWSVGVTIYVMATGTKPFQNLDINKRRLEELFKTQRLRIPYTMSKELADLITRLLERDEEHRLSVEEIKDHPFFNGIKWSDVEQKVISPPLLPHSANVLNVSTTIRHSEHLRNTEMKMQNRCMEDLNCIPRNVCPRELQCPPRTACPQELQCPPRAAIPQRTGSEATPSKRIISHQEE